MKYNKGVLLFFLIFTFLFTACSSKKPFDDVTLETMQGYGEISDDYDIVLENVIEYISICREMYDQSDKKKISSFTEDEELSEKLNNIKINLKTYGNVSYTNAAEIKKAYKFAKLKKPYLELEVKIAEAGLLGNVDDINKEWFDEFETLLIKSEQYILNGEYYPNE